jgi:choline kinase
VVGEDGVKTPLVATLAAGMGSRLGAGAAGRPKCMSELGGRTLLDWQRDAFERAGMRRRVLVVREGAGLTTVPGEQLRIVDGRGGPMDSLFALPPAEVADGVVSCYGDIAFHPRHLEALLRAPGDVRIVADRHWLSLWSLRFDAVLDDAERFRALGDRLTAIGGRARDASEIEAQFTGLMMLTSTGWDRLEALRCAGDDTTGLLSRALASKVAVGVAFVSGGWCEVDTATDLHCYRTALERSGGWSHDWRGP